MTILVGYVPNDCADAALDLGARIALAAGEDLVVTTVTPQPWTTPSMAKVDAEFAAWATTQGEEAIAAARTHLTATWPQVPVTYNTVTGHSVSAALLAEADAHGADVLVLGSSTDGAVGTVAVGATADRLLHSAHVPLAIAPRGYPLTGPTVSRITCAYGATSSSFEVLAATAVIARRVGAPLRVATFGVRGRTMYPPEVGLHAENEVLDAWRVQTTQAQAQALAALGDRKPEDTTAVVASGSGWTEAMTDLPWLPDEVLVVGSSPLGPIARVFVGSRATKIIRHSPVPVVVVPAVAAEQVLDDAGG